ncbi:MAG: hypothetical protein EB127_17595 [Alphaproteobacteria bacterium]|nr:hypothetical protein [Alphaproteobacteria bacterium]
MFQRILIAKNVEQVRQSFLIGAVVCLFIRIASSFIALVVLAHNPNLPPNNIAMYVIDNYGFTGLKGVAIVGIMAMIMSTADSWINIGSVIFSHDFCKPLGIKFKNELFLSRTFAICAGFFAVILALSASDLLKLLLLQSKFYKPIVMPPLLLAILGFRSTTKAVSIGMISGALSVIIWLNFITPATGIDGIMPSVFTNFLTFVSSHSLLKQKGGWIKTYSKPASHINKKRGILDQIYSNIESQGGLMGYCAKQTPKNEMLYLYFAFFSLLIAVATISMKRDAYMHNFALVNQIEVITLLVSTLFFANKLWPADFREKYIGLIWQISIFLVLSFSSSFLVLISDFSEVSLIMFILSLTMVGVLLTWQNALLISILGVLVAYIMFRFFVGDVDDASGGLYNPKLKIWYIVLIIGSFILAFIKPKQEYQELTEEKAEHLLGRIDAKDEEVRQALALKGEFIRNVTHEYHAPMTGVISMAETLHDSYDKLSDAQKKGAIKVILESAHKLKSYDENIATLSILSKGDYMSKEDIDFSELLLARINSCKKLYEKNTEDRFVLEIEEGIIVNG